MTENLSVIQKPRILFIDDSTSQLALYREQMADHYHVDTAAAYEEAMAILSQEPVPEVICLDLVMPKVDGFQFLAILKGTVRFQKIPIIMVSSENDPQLVRRTFLMGASDFVRKPYDEEELKLRINRLIVPLPVSDIPLNPEVSETRLSITAQAVMIAALTDLAQTRDNETGYHLLRIQKYTGLIAQLASGRPEFRPRLSDEMLESIGELSVLHDIGKVGIPDSILCKAGPLTPQEFEIMKTHTTIGYETIKHLRQKFPRYSFLEWAQSIALSHHERWDGTGYPQGLKGEAIPLVARIVAIADVFDALTTKRVYKDAYPLEKAFQMMQAGRGEHFDPQLFDIFAANLKDFERISTIYQPAPNSSD